jgi:hypothetical protein
MSPNLVNKIMIDGSCRRCGGEISIEVSLGQLVQINTGGLFIRRYELFMPAFLKPEDRKCPHCGSDHFGEVYR